MRELMPRKILVPSLLKTLRDKRPWKNWFPVRVAALFFETMFNNLPDTEE